MNPTPEQKSRHERDLATMSGGEKPFYLAYFHDGWSAAFRSELSALRVANKYLDAAGPVKHAEGYPDIWLVNVNPKHLQK